MRTGVRCPAAACHPLLCGQGAGSLACRRRPPSCSRTHAVPWDASRPPRLLLPLADTPFPSSLQLVSSYSPSKTQSVPLLAAWWGVAPKLRSTFSSAGSFLDDETGVRSPPVPEARGSHTCWGIPCQVSPTPPGAPSLSRGAPDAGRECVKASGLFSAAQSWLFSHRAFWSVELLRGLGWTGAFVPSLPCLGRGME